MAQEYIIKNGLIYTQDLKTILGVDLESGLFTGRIPFGVHFIDDDVFSECPYESISLPDSIEKLGNALFKDSPNLKSIRLPSYLDELPPYMLAGCKNLTKITMPTQILGYAKGVFKDCVSLQDIPFRAGIEDIPEEFCCGCTSITSLVFPQGTKRIESKAIANCSNLRAVVFPSSIEYIAEDAFDQCNCIQNIRIEGENPYYFVSKEDGCLYKKEENQRIMNIKSVNTKEVTFFKDNVDDEEEPFFSNEDVNEIDETFSAEVCATVEEISTLQNNIEEGSLTTMNEEENQLQPQSIDDMDIFDTPEQQEVEIIEPESDEAESDEIDSKTSILINSVKINKILECSKEDLKTAKGTLYVIAEECVKNPEGKDDFSPKLMLCTLNILHIQNFRRAVLLNGLPFENDE